MARYFFHLHHGGFKPDTEGAEFRSDLDAWRQGTRACGELLRDLDGRIASGPEYRMECVDQTGRSVFEISFSARTALR